MNFTEEKHRQTGYILQVIHNQLCSVTENIRRSTRANTVLYQLANMLSPLNDTNGGPVKILKDSLENELCKETPCHDSLKVYSLNGQPDFKCPELLWGVSGHPEHDDLATYYEAKRKERAMTKSSRKLALSKKEIKAVSLFLQHCRAELFIIGKPVAAHYGEDYQAAIAAGQAVRAIGKLVDCLDPQPVPSCIRGTLTMHQHAAHDIPLLHLLLAEHCNLLIAAYDPAIRQKHPVANAARTATESMEELKNKIHEQAQAELPGADWLQQFSRQILPGTVRITGEEVSR